MMNIDHHDVSEKVNTNYSVFAYTYFKKKKCYTIAWVELLLYHIIILFIRCLYTNVPVSSNILLHHHLDGLRELKMESWDLNILLKRYYTAQL